MNTQRLVELTEAWRDDSLSSEQSRELNELLRGSAEARKFFLAEAQMHGLLHTAVMASVVGETSAAILSPVPPSATWHRPWFSWRPLTAAAAGLVFGLFSASVVWAYAAPRFDFRPQRVITLLNESFESTAQPGVTGMPPGRGVWGGDHARIVGAEQNLKPHSGTAMLRLLRADFEGERPLPGSASDQVRSFDLREFEGLIVSGNAVLDVSSWFSLVRLQPNEVFAVEIHIHAFAKDPAVHQSKDWDTWLGDEHIAMGGRRSRLQGNPQTDWTRVCAQLQLPPGTQYVNVHVRVKRTEPAPTGGPVEFAGAYVDDVVVKLTVPQIAGGTARGMSTDAE